MISCIEINFKAVIINLYLSVETFVDQAAWLANGSRIQKERFALHSSIWDMQVPIETDVCINLLRPQIQLLKRKVDMEEMAMSLSNYGPRQIRHQSFWIAVVKVHIPCNNLNPLPYLIIRRKLRVSVMENRINLSNLMIPNFFYNSTVAMRITHDYNGLLCHAGNTSTNFLTA